MKEAHDHGLFAVGMCGGQTINFMVEKLGGTEPALMAFYDDPELGGRPDREGGRRSRSNEGRRSSRPAWIASTSAIPTPRAASFRPISIADFARRPIARSPQEFHRQGVFCYKHCCGNYNPLLDDFASIGVDAMDGMDPTSGMSVRRTKEKIGDRVTLMGGLSCLTLLGGTPETGLRRSKAVRFGWQARRALRPGQRVRRAAPFAPGKSPGRRRGSHRFRIL